MWPLRQTLCIAAFCIQTHVVYVMCRVASLAAGPGASRFSKCCGGAFRLATFSTLSHGRSRVRARALLLVSLSAQPRSTRDRRP